MSTTPILRQTTLSRAIKAAQANGLVVVGAEIILPDRIKLQFGPAMPDENGPLQEWREKRAARKA